jgi:Acetyltransferase (GNAT) domain
VRADPFTEAAAGRWDELVDRAPMATFLHSRRFLSYHGDRLVDASLVLVDERDHLRAVLPAALDPAVPERVVSHPGATFGGVVHDGTLDAAGVRAALAASVSEYASRGLTVLVYKPVPHIYHRSPSADDIWALNDLGGSRSECSLSTTIDLDARLPPSGRRRRSRKKASTVGVAVDEGITLAEFWPLLESVLAQRHGARPVHTIEEIEELQRRFPEGIRMIAASLGTELVAGAVLFVTARVTHLQYMAASDEGMRAGAMDIVLERGIECAAEDGTRYFDFGTSMEDGGQGLQTSLQTFKASFGGGGVIHERYELPLREEGQP